MHCQALFLTPGAVDDMDPSTGLYSACTSNGTDCLIYEADGAVEARVCVKAVKPAPIQPLVASS